MDFTAELTPVLDDSQDADCLEIGFDGDLAFVVQVANWDDRAAPEMNVCSFGHSELGSTGLRSLLPPYQWSGPISNETAGRIIEAVPADVAETDEESYIVFRLPTSETEIQSCLDELAAEFDASVSDHRTRTLQNLPGWWPDMLAPTRS